MDKLVAVVAGEAFAAYVDLRPASATYGDGGHRPRCARARQVLVPERGGQRLPGHRRGRHASTSTASTRSGRPAWPGSACTPLDPALGIEWPLPIDPDDQAQVSEKDRDAPALAELAGGDRMKLLVTGGAGFIGSNYVRYVLARDRRRGRRVRRPHLRREPVHAQGRRRRPPLLLREGRHLRPGHPRGGDGRRATPSCTSPPRATSTGRSSAPTTSSTRTASAPTS